MPRQENLAGAFVYKLAGIRLFLPKSYGILSKKEEFPMKKQIASITAVCLVLALLTGCAGIADYFRQLGQLLGGEAVKFTEMEYTRPDMTHFQ